MKFDQNAFIKTFSAEADDILEQFEQGLVFLESHPKDSATINNLFRLAHTMKGSSATIGFNRVAEFVHVVEDVLQLLKGEVISVDAGLISLLLESVDATRELVEDGKKGEKNPRPGHETILQNLVKYRKGDRRKKAARRKGGVRRKSAEGRRKLENGEAGKPTVQKEIPTAGGGAPEVPVPPGKGSNLPDHHAETLRVDVEKLDRMVNLTGEIAIANGRLRQLLTSKFTDEETVEVQETVDRLFLELQGQVMKVRMVPVGPTFQRYARTVRDVARMRNKEIRLVLEGEEVEVDMMVIEQLVDPLTHMVRNSADHGIEDPDVRRKMGKERFGTITLRAFHDAGSIVIQVEDDGAGLIRKTIYDHGLLMNLVAPEQEISDEDVFRLIFEPGFTTARAVTGISGRGVGMDVVRESVKHLRGSIDIKNLGEGVGIRFTIRLPLTLAIIDGFSVGVGDETFVIPLDGVVECMEMPEENRGMSKTRGVIHRPDGVLPYFRLSDFFCMEGIPSEGDDSFKTSKKENIIVVSHLGQKTGIVVDELFGEGQAVIKPLGKLFEGRAGIAGSTIIGNGRVALILDIPSLIKEAPGRVSRAIA